MLGEMILSWKYPTRLVIVNLVPIGAFFLFLTSPVSTRSASTPAVTDTSAIGGRWKPACSALGVFTLCRSDLSASDRPSLIVSLSSSESDGSDALSSSMNVSPSSFCNRSGASQLMTLVDMARGRDLVRPLAAGDRGFLSLFSAKGDMASFPKAWPQVCCFVRR